MFEFVFPTTTDETEELINYTFNLELMSSENVSSFQVYINGDYYGENLSQIQINTNDTLSLQIVRVNATEVAKITYMQQLI